MDDRSENIDQKRSFMIHYCPLLMPYVELKFFKKINPASPW